MADVWPVELCGILMDSVTPDSDGVRWARNSLTGWDSPPVRLFDDDRTGRHGGYGSSRLYAARQLTLNAIAYCPDMATAERVMDRIHSMPGPSESGELIVHSSAPKMLTVKMGDGGPRASWPIDISKPYVRVQIPLVAHDPFKRAATGNTPVAIGAASSGVVDNAGTAAADLLVTLTSGGTVVLTAGGLTLTTGSLPSGAVIDTGADTVRSSGGDDLSSLVVSPWRSPAVPSGGGSVTQAGTANLSVVTFDTYR